MVKVHQISQAVAVAAELVQQAELVVPQAEQVLLLVLLVQRQLVERVVQV
jgi:hypothetical protein